MATDSGRSFLLAILLAGLAPVQGLAEGKPLSAIDWLSDTVARPPPRVAEPPAKPPGVPDRITTTPLSDRNLDAVGVLPGSVTGIDRRLWSGSTTAALTALIRAERVDPLPAMRDLLQTLVLAELDPPFDSDGSGAFLLARIDRLLELGALEAATALVAAAGKPTPELFRRRFDISLLLGTEDSACSEQRRTPQIAPTFPARIFCLARGGDWQAAELTLRTAQAIGQVTQEEENLLERFLAPEDFEEADPLPAPERLTPLALRMYEAIGEPISATSLPLAFAHGDLTPATGWKARLEAGERLARTGAIAPAQLFELYRERRPAASGGVWTRVAAVQRFEQALARGNPAQIGPALQSVWTALAEQELEIPFAETHAAALSTLRLPGEAGNLAFRITLLGPDYEKAAIARSPADDTEGFLIGLARGRATVAPPPDGLARAIAPAFSATGTPPPLLPAAREMVEEGRRGELALMAIDKVTTGALGDRRGVTEGLSILRHLGLEGAARKAALQLMLLERRG